MSREAQIGAGMVTLGASWYAFETSRGGKVQEGRGEDVKMEKLENGGKNEIDGQTVGAITGKRKGQGRLERRSVSTGRKKL